MAVLCAGWGMISTKMNRAKALLLAAGVLTALACPALAQSAPTDKETEAEAAEETPAPTADDEDVLKDIDVSKLDWSQLNVDASTLGDGPAAKAARLTGARRRRHELVEQEQANGSSAVSVKQSVTPFWDARIGADMTVTREPTTMSELLAEKTANGGNLPQSGGSAWAAITAPGAGSVWDKTAVEARVDPNQDQEQARHLHQQAGSARRPVFADAVERRQSDPAGRRAGARRDRPAPSGPTRPSSPPSSR